MTKPKIKTHLNRCHHATYTCIDCNTYFSNNNDAFNHNQCITEAQKWHGKYAQQSKDGNAKQNQNKAQEKKAEEPKKIEEAKTPEKKDETPKKGDKDNKRKREDSDKEADETPNKKAKVEEKSDGEKEELVEEAKFSDFKWKKYTNKTIKGSSDKSMKVEDLRKQVVDQYLERVRSDAEAYFDAQIAKNKRVKVSKGVAKFGSD